MDDRGGALRVTPHIATHGGRGRGSAGAALAARRNLIVASQRPSMPGALACRLVSHSTGVRAAIVGHGAELEDAVQYVYREAARVNFQDMYLRTDIGQRPEPILANNW